MTRVLVTGATGFVGSHVTAACLHDGCEVGALVLPQEAETARDRLGEAVAIFPGTLEAPPWHDLTAWQPDACIHCAWIATPGVYMESPLNLDFRRWSAALFARLASVGTQRLIGVGSCAERLVPEKGPAAPLYARSKDQLRQYLLGGVGQASTVWTRLFYPYGVGEARERLISSLIAAFADGRSFAVRCPGTRKDYVHVDDVGRALAALVRAPTTGIVDIGTGTGVCLGDLARTVAAQMGCPELLVLGDQTDPLGDMVADAAALHGIGWCPTIALEEGVAAMVARAASEGEV